MWDEKQFFEDFAKESDKIKPSDEFVADLKRMNNEADIIELKRKKNTRTVFRTASIAAAIAVLLAAGIGIYAIIRPAGDNPDDGEQIKIPIHAGKDTPTTGEADNSEESPVGTDAILELIEKDDVLIVDGEGNSISQGERSDLKSMFEHAVETDTISGLFGENTEYIIKAEKDITIRIYFDEYILVNGSDMYCVE